MLKTNIISTDQRMIELTFGIEQVFQSEEISNGVQSFRGYTRQMMELEINALLNVYYEDEHDDVIDYFSSVEEAEGLINRLLPSSDWLISARYCKGYWCVFDEDRSHTEEHEKYGSKECIGSSIISLQHALVYGVINTLIHQANRSS